VRVAKKEDLIFAVNETPIGRTVKVRAIDRQGKIVELPVKISKRNAEFVQVTPRLDNGADLDEFEENPDKSGAIPASSAHPAKAKFTWRGLQFRELNAEDSFKRGGKLEVIRVKKGSPADRAGFFEGAILTELKLANNPSVLKLETVDDLKRLVDGVNGPASINTALDGLITIEEK
jgi:hypothetical protein